jgi:hypothetical protein
LKRWKKVFFSVKGVGARIPEESLMALVTVRLMAATLRAARVVLVARVEIALPATIEFMLYVYLFFIDRREII